MNDQEREYFVNSFVEVHLNRPPDDIKKAMARQFSRPFTDAEVSAEKSALYRNVRNGVYTNTAGTEERRVNAIGEALDRAILYANPKNRLMAAKLSEMTNLWLGILEIAGMVEREREETDDSDISYEDFQLRVCSKMDFAPGRKGWFLGFMAGTGKYEYEHQTKWRRTGWVPREALRDAENMDVEAAIKAATKTQPRWTKADLAALYGFLKISDGSLEIITGHTNRSVAKKLTEQLGRYITEGSVKRQIHNLRKESATDNEVHATAEAPANQDQARQNFLDRLARLGSKPVIGNFERTPVDTD